MDMPFLDATIWRQKMPGAHKHTATCLGASLLAQGTGCFPFSPPHPTELLGHPPPSLLHSWAIYPSPQSVNFKSQTGLLFSISTATSLAYHPAISHMDGFSGSSWHLPFSSHPCFYSPASPEQCFETIQVMSFTCLILFRGSLSLV